MACQDGRTNDHLASASTYLRRPVPAVSGVHWRNAGVDKSHQEAWGRGVMSDKLPPLWFRGACLLAFAVMWVAFIPALTALEKLIAGCKWLRNQNK